MAFVEIGNVKIGHVVFFELAADHEKRVLRCVRTEAHFTDMPQLEAAFKELARLTGTILHPESWGLLLDLRRGPGRNDAQFEDTIAPHRKALCSCFLRVATLVSSASGRLQVQRHAHQDGVNLVAFGDETSALHHLEGTADVARARHVRPSH